MSVIEEYVEAYNAGDVAGAMALAGDQYRYYDPTTGDADKATNEALMHQMLAAYPDRRLSITTLAVGDGCEFAECELHATPAAGGQPIHLTGVVAVRVAGGKMTSQRWYYDPPPTGLLEDDG